MAELEDLYGNPPTRPRVRNGNDVTGPSLATPPFPSGNNSVNSNLGLMGLNLIGLLNKNLITHPFLILSRQSQVNMGSYYYHVTPFRLVGVACHLYRCQGSGVFVKGLGSSLTIKGLNLASQDILGKFTP